MKRITLMLAFLFAISWHSEAALFTSESFDSEKLSTLDMNPFDSFEAFQANCTSPQATTSIDEDCVNGVYTINVDVTDMGDATSLTITNDLGAPSLPVTSTGVVSFGPIPVGTVINLVLEHDGDSDCHLDLGSFKDTCPAPNDTLAGAIPITPSAPGTGCDTPTFSHDYGDGSVTDSGLDGSCDGSSTGLDLFYSWTATSPALIWNDGDSNPGIIIRQPDGTEITCESTYASDDTVLSGWNIGDDLIIQIYDFGTAAELVSFCLEELTCPAPSDLVVSNITTTEADLSWTSNGGETEWTVIYGAEGFDPLTEGTSIEDNDGNLGVTISGLTASTSYDFYVKANCGPGDESVLAGPASFATQCVSTSSFPLSENFDGNWSGSPAAPSCWTVVNNDNDSYTWTQSASYITPRSGSSTAHGMGNEDDYLISPALDFSATNDMQIIWYDVVESSSQNNTYDVLVSTTNTDVASFTDNLGTFDVTNTEWEEHILDLSAYTGQTIYVAFHQTQSGSSIYGFGIDDVTIEEIPSCLMPENVAVSAPTTTSMDLSWDEEPGATDGYVLYAFAEGADPYSDTPEATETVAAGVTTGTISGLNPSTIYNFYVASDCGTEGTSAFSEPVIVASTVCNATNIPFVQDFESVTTPELPNCGTIETIAGNDWQTHNQTSYGFDSNVLRYRYSTSSAADAWYFTRGINLVAGENYQISYQYGNNSTTYTENLKVAYGTSASAASMTENIDDHTISLSGSEVNEVTFTVPTDGVYYFGFQAYSDVNEYYLYVDDIQIDLAPACIKPSNLIASNVNGNSFDLDWNAISTETDGYEWFVMASGENPDVDTPIQTGTTGTGVTTVSITGLSETTTYDVYVRTDCGVEGMSDYSDTLTVETTVTCAAPTDLALNETNVTSTSAEFTWTASASEELGYDWVVMTEGEDPAVDTPVETGTTASGETSVTINNLSPATAYDFYILSNCDANGLSDYAGPVSFSTLCDATNVPFVQDFESVTTPELPNCGTIETIAGNDWQTHNQISYGFDSNVLRYRYSTSSAADAWYFTRGINLVAGENYQISYQYGNNSTTFTENLKVAFGTSADAASMTENIDDHTISLSGSEVNEVTFTVPADGVYYFGFQAYSDVDEYYLYVDNIEIDIAPTCIAPANVAVSNITTDSADFAWDAEASEVNGYEWYLMAAGEEPEVDTPVQTGTTATGETSVTLTGLTPTTSYDFYVRTDCDTEGVSAFTSTLNFETMLGAVIVTPGTTESGTYCYENNDFKEWLFESSDGSPLTIEFIQGTLETNLSGGTHDDLMIYDGSDDTGVVLYDSDNPTTTAGELAGLIFTAQSGMMYITLDADGSSSCSSGSETEIIFNVDADVTTGNQDFFSDANFSYYPNPVQSSFEINSTYELEQVVIYNMLGQEVRNISPQSTDVNFDLSDVQAGVYLVKATVKGQTQTFRLIKE